MNQLIREGCKNDQAVLIRSSTDNYQRVSVGCSNDRVFISDLDRSHYLKVKGVCSRSGEGEDREDVDHVNEEDERFEVLKKYSNLHKMNNGGIFRVCGMQQDLKGCYAIDEKRFGRKVIILKLLNLFSTANLNHHHHLLLPWSSIREIEFFKKTTPKYHDFFINLHDILIPTTPKLFDSVVNELYMVYDVPDDFTSLEELHSCSRRNINVDQFLRSHFSTYCSSSSYTPSPSPPRYLNNRNRKPLSNDRLCQDLLTQLLLLLFYLKTRKVVIRNFIPDNLYVSPYNDRPLNWTTRLKLQMWNVGCHVKSSTRRRRSILEEEIDQVTMRTDINAIYYGAPELMLGFEDDHPSDMWSLGCIFAELLGWPHVVFMGDSRKEQLNMITQMIGDPRVEEIDAMMKTRDGDETMIKWFKRFLLKRVEEGGGRPRIPFSDMLPNANGLALELLEQMLLFDPTKRITVEAALHHPYIQDFIASDDVYRKKFMDLASVHKKLVKEEEGKNKGGGGGKDEEEEEEGWDGGILNHQLCRRILMREKFLFYNREAIVKVHKKYTKAAIFKGRFAT